MGPRYLSFLALLALVCFSSTLVHAACTPPSGGGVAVCSPANSANTVNPVHYIAAASSPNCSGGVSSMSVVSSSGSTLYTISGSHLDAFLPTWPGSYTTTIRATDKCGGTQQASVSLTVRGTAVITYRYDNQRTGANPYETQLTPSNVNASSFGKVFACSVDSYVYGEPLFMPKLNIAGGTHNVVFVATENNSIYAFDADGKSCTPLWHTYIDKPVPCSTNSPVTGANCDLILRVPGVGITSTMVIDPTQGSQGVLYVEARTSPTGAPPYYHGLHKLDVGSGQEMSDSPAVLGGQIAGNSSCDSVNGVVTFDSAAENNRSALLYADGVVYAGFGSINDVPTCSNGGYHGWILGYNAFSLKQQAAVFNTTRNRSNNGSGGGGYGAIWGGALVADPSNEIFANTGNGPFDPSVGDYSNTFLKMQRSGSTLAVLDFFSPHALYINDDHDLGSSTAIVVAPGGPYPHELVGVDKPGNLYVVNRDSMGKYNSSSDNVLQEMQNAVGVHVSGAVACDTSGDDDCNYSSPAYWNGHIYVAGVNDHLKQFTFSNGLLTGPTSKASQTFAFPGSTPMVSANATSNAIVWVVEPSKAILHAYSATDLTKELYNSSQNSTRDALGGYVKFAPPTVVNGHVYVGTNKQLVGYGLLSAPSGSLAVTVTSPTNGATVSNPVQVTASATGPNPISRMEVWDNYKNVYTVSGSSINTKLTLPTGSNERFVVQAVDSTGATAKVVESITVSGSSSSLAVTVTSPTNGATVSNPVQVTASATGPNPISQMQVWVNYKMIYSVSGASINTKLTLATGSNERFVVQAVDSTGATAKVVESITVS